MSASPKWWAERRLTWSHISTTARSYRRGLEPKTNYLDCSTPYTWTIRNDCAIPCYSPIGNLTQWFQQTHLLQRTLPARTRCRLHIHIRRPHPVRSLRQKASHLKHSRTRRSQKGKHHEKNYCWIRRSYGHPAPIRNCSWVWAWRQL